MDKNIIDLDFEYNRLAWLAWITYHLQTHKFKNQMAIPQLTLHDSTYLQQKTKSNPTVLCNRPKQLVHAIEMRTKIYQNQSKDRSYH